MYNNGKKAFKITTASTLLSVLGECIMGKIRRKTKKNKDFITYQLEGSECIDVKELTLLSNPGITAISALQIVKKKKELYFVCDVAGRITLKEYLKEQITLREFLNVLHSITRVLTGFSYLQMEHQLLLLEDEYILIDATTKAISFIYLPILHPSKRYDISYFLLHFFQQVGNASGSLQHICEQYIEFLEGGITFNTKAFCYFHQQIVEKYGASIPQMILEHPGSKLEEIRALPHSFFQKQCTGREPVEVGTVYLIRKKGKERIAINKEVFCLGKDYKEVDYRIEDNEMISGVHAEIVKRNGEYYICDQFSTNGTFVNGQLLSSELEQKIVSGSQIRLADEEFEFVIGERKG